MKDRLADKHTTRGIKGFFNIWGGMIFWGAWITLALLHSCTSGLPSY